MLPNDKIVKGVCDGPDGLFQNSPKSWYFQINLDSIILDCSTISPFSAIDLNKLGSKSDKLYIDSPVSGGIGAAAAGSLTFMVGVENIDVFHRCE